MGRRNETKVKQFQSRYEKEPIEREVELFTWEKTDRVEELRRAFGLTD